MRVLTCKQYTGHDVDPTVYDGRGGGDVKAIVLHHTGSSNEMGDANWLSQHHVDPVSIHQLILRNGDIVQIVGNNLRAWHAGLSAWGTLEDLNTWSVGVEICNNGTTEPYTPAQLETVAQTVAYNCARFKVPDNYVVTHKQVRDEWIKRHGPADIKTDPHSWQMDSMFKRVNEIRAKWPFPIPLWSCMS